MNKLFSKIAVLSVGLAMALGVSIAVSQKAPVKVKAEGKITTLAGITSGKSYFIGATVSETDYYFYASGGIETGTGLSGVSTSSTEEATVVTFIGGDSSWALQLENGYYLSLATSKANGKYNVVRDAVNFTVSEISGLLKIAIDSTYCIQLNTTTKSHFGSYNGGQTNVWLEEASFVPPVTVESVAVSGSMTKTTYFVGEQWDPAGLVVTVTYEGGSSEVVTKGITWSYSAEVPLVPVTSLVVTATYGGKSGSSAAQAVTVTRANPLQAVYFKSGGASIDVYGYYAGFLSGTGPVIMDGEYGIVAYAASHDVSKYTKDTILHITGALKIYNGLYEIVSQNSPKVNLVITDVTESVSEANKPLAPVTYAVTGGETEEYESRITTITGVVKSVAPRKEGETKWEKDTNVYVTVGGKDILCFCKGGAISTADGAKIEAAIGGTAITLKGFTGWFNGFQVTVTGLVEAKEDYSAEQFALDLLDQTDAICEGWTEGKNNHDALETIWSNLASEDKYPSLPQDQKDILAAADREGSSVVERAMMRYDFLTGKYNLNNFIEGRTPIAPAKGYVSYNVQNSNAILVIILSVSAMSVVAFTVLFVLRKKKRN